MKERLLGPLTRRWPWLATAVRAGERFGEVHGAYLGSAVTLTAFLSLFPLLLAIIGAVGFFSHNVTDLTGEVISRLGLTGDAATAVERAIAVAEHSRRAASLIGVAGLLWSGLGLVSALQFCFDSVWQVAGRGVKDRLLGLAWLIGAGALFVASAAFIAGLRLLPGPAWPVVVLATAVVDVSLWLWSFKALTNREVGWRALLPGAVVGAVGLEALKVLGGILVPRAIASSSALYGSIGVVFATLAWLLFFGRLVVYAAVLNVVRWEEGHGTVTAEIEVPRLPGQVATVATRAGEVQPDPSSAS